VLLEKAVNHLANVLMVAHVIAHQCQWLFQQPFDLLDGVESVDTEGNLFKCRKREGFYDRLVGYNSEQ
jgi:hypothetical protein